MGQDKATSYQTKEEKPFRQISLFTEAGCSLLKWIQSRRAAHMIVAISFVKHGRSGPRKSHDDE